MDTISRENTSSPLPIVGIVAGLLGVILAAVALVKVSSTNKAMEEQGTKITQIDSINVNAQNAKAAADAASKEAKGLRSEFNDVLNQQIGPRIIALEDRITKLEESAKRPPAAVSKSGAGPVTAGPGEYVVKAGDNLSKIGAANGGFTSAEVMAVNPGVNPNALKIGQKLKLPTRGTSAAK